MQKTKGAPQERFFCRHIPPFIGSRRDKIVDMNHPKKEHLPDMKKTFILKKTLSALFPAAAATAAFSAAAIAGACATTAESRKTMDDGNPFGVCSHPFAQREINLLEPLFDKMREAGVQWLRFDFVWTLIERQSGQYNFAVYDQIVDSLAERNIKVLGILTCRRGKSQFYIDAKDRQDWLDYITATVKHFKGRISHWEVVNEPNMKKDKDLAFAAEYGRALKDASLAIRKANPDAAILFGGLAGVDKGFVEAALAQCPTGNFDIMNFHSYPAPAMPEENFEKCIATLEGAMDKFGGRKPIWLTETGVSTPEEMSGEALIKTAAKKFGLFGKKVAAISDGIEDSSRQAKRLFDGAKVKKIPYSKIKTLDENYVLVLPSTQEFPYEYIGDLANFAMSGGSIIQNHGYPFVFDTSGKSGGAAGLNLIGANLTPHWLYNPKLPSTVRVSEAKKLKVFENAKTADIRFLRCFNYDAKHSPEGTVFTPLITLEINGKTIAPAAAYRFPSGGVFIGVASTDAHMSEKFQAAMLARSYIFALSRGAQKVFNYNFRSHGEVSVIEGSFGLVRKDMSEKPAFKAYQTLTKFIGKYPQITYTQKGGICRADWISPDGDPVCALWKESGLPKNIELQLEGEKYRLVKISGKTAKEAAVESGKPVELKITTIPVYLAGANVKSLNTNPEKKK